jgi:hypothetical protein
MTTDVVVWTSDVAGAALDAASRAHQRLSLCWIPKVNSRWAKEVAVLALTKDARRLVINLDVRSPGILLVVDSQELDVDSGDRLVRRLNAGVNGSWQSVDEIMDPVD